MSRAGCAWSGSSPDASVHPEICPSPSAPSAARWPRGNHRKRSRHMTLPTDIESFMGGFDLSESIAKANVYELLSARSVSGWTT